MARHETGVSVPVLLFSPPMTEWRLQARQQLLSADNALRNETTVRAVALISEARMLLPDRASVAGHELRGMAALMMADAWACMGALDATYREIKRARGHAFALRSQSTSSWRDSAFRSSYVLDLKAKLATAVKAAGKVTP